MSDFNSSLRLLSRALVAQRQSIVAKNKDEKILFAKRAMRLLADAANSQDSGRAVRIIRASLNKNAVKAEDIDTDSFVAEDVDNDDVEVFTDSDFIGDGVAAVASEDDAKDDDEDKKDDDAEVDSAVLRVLSRNRKRRALLRSMRAKRLASEVEDVDEDDDDDDDTEVTSRAHARRRAIASALRRRIERARKMRH